ncbi:MAG: VCBS repeat-containing protein [Planctomycetes bacterium]|nr:VCBS repeat-containing protein [Planctomycetota bacterium]
MAITSRNPIAFVVFLLGTAAVGQSWPTPVFDAPLVVLGNNSDSMIEVLDYDGNGQREAVSIRVAWGGQTVSTLTVRLRALQGTAPTLGLVTTIATPNGADPFSATGQLFAADGRDDFVLGVGLDLSLFKGGQSTRHTAIASTSTILGTAIGDYDGDGLGDVAVLTAQHLTIHFAQPGDTLAAPVSLALPAGSGPHLLQAEVTGDARPDLVVIGANADLYTIVGGQITATGSLPVNLQHPMPVAGDIDGDGDVDVVVFDDADYVVLRRTGPTTFAAEPSVAGGPATHLFDVDGDGDLDGACCGGGGPLPAVLFAPMTFRVSLNDNGVFAPAYELHGIGGYHLAGILDVNGDGFQDLVSGRAIYFARRSLGAPTTAVNPFGADSPNAVADLDADGDPDWLVDPAVQNENLGNGEVLLHGLRLMQSPAPGTHYAPPVITGDFDGDGDSDLIVEVRNGTTAIGTRLLLQRGGAFADGGMPFPAYVTLSPYLGTGSDRAVVADLDGDGDLDLASNSETAPLWSHHWLNDGGGIFTFDQAFTGEHTVAVHDFTGDNRPDLIVSDGRLLLRRGTPGGFGARELLTIAGYPYFNAFGSFDPLRDSVACADFDGDGHIDLVAGERTTSGGCYPVVLQNNGAGNPLFTPIGSSGAPAGINGLEPCRIIAGDVDRDGHPDIVLSNPFNAGWNGAAVAFGTGGLPFFDGLRTQQLLVPIRALADLDGDGDLDGIGERTVLCRLFEGSTVGDREQWGTGSPGLGGIAPCLGATAVARAGQSPEFRVSGCIGQTVGLLAFGLQTRALPMFGGTSFIDPLGGLPFFTDGQAGVAGDGRATVAFGPLHPGLVGVRLQLQTASYDANASGSIVLSNAVTMTVGS